MSSYVSDPSIGYSSALNITSDTVIKTGAGLISTISILVAGTTAGAIHDVATIGAAAASNKVLTLPNTVSVIPIRWQVSSGIVVIPGTSQVIAVTYS